MSRPRIGRLVVVFAAFLFVVLLLQMASGAYRSEFGAYPDEPAHYVTSLMVREYVTGPQPIWPLKFAENYYAHYPKVAFGHWPPLFYVVQAGWMMLFSASRASVRLELAFTTALLAFSVFIEAKRWFGERAGVLAGLFVVCLPLVQASTDEEMAEMLLVLTCFWSAAYFARYLESERRKDALWFAVFFSLAVLTKGSGWLLALVPPVAALLAKRIRLLFRPAFGLAVALIAACCLPWQLMTMQLAERGWTGGSHPNWQYTSKALVKFVAIMVASLGAVQATLIAVGVLVAVLVPLVRCKRCEPWAAVMLALILSDWLFHSVVPAGVEDRKMIIAVPALALFLLAGGLALADRIPATGILLEYRRALVTAAVAVAFFAHTFAIPRITHFGYVEAARFITLNPALRQDTILASSESLGEGLFISEMAMRQPRPLAVIIRGTKALADVDWIGSHYRARFTTTQQLLQYIQQAHIGLVVTDDFPPIARFSHTKLLQEAMQQDSEHFHLVGTFSAPSSPGRVRVFEVR